MRPRFQLVKMPDGTDGDYGVTISVVSRIVSGRMWAHV